MQYKYTVMNLNQLPELMHEPLCIFLHVYSCPAAVRPHAFGAPGQ